MAITYKVDKLYPWLYRFSDPLDVYFYLIVGKKEALLFDTGFGIGDIEGAVRKITKLPLTVVLGHAHIDHANGAYQFEKVYLHKGDYDLYRQHTSADTRLGILQNLKQKGLELDQNHGTWVASGAADLSPLEYDKVFDLGGLKVKVINMAGHTAGSVGLLILEKKVLLDSDSANGHCWLFLEETLPLREYIAMLKRVYELDFDAFYTAHNKEKFPKDLFEAYIAVAKNANLAEAKPYERMSALKPFVYTEGDVSIVFSERTLKG
ncbi:MAG: MBL fold metallo-hydrolase [Treponema sp.]|nr:MBL fold metallo-hydrolase [Treponema sp.]